MTAPGKSRKNLDTAITIFIAGLGLLNYFSAEAFRGKVTLASIGAWSAMIGTYLCLWLLLAISRIPLIEKEIGHGDMVKIHKYLAPAALSFIGLHVFFTVKATSVSHHQGWVSQLFEYTSQYDWVFPAAISVFLLYLLALISWNRIKKYLPYEFWWHTHTIMYVAVALSFMHQILLGTILSHYIWLKYFWISLYVCVTAMIVYGRIVKPVIVSTKHSFRVEKVIQESQGIYSVYISGRNLTDLNFYGGQFFHWRFLNKSSWWQSHPYSISSSPKDNFIRITVKDLGKHSGKVIPKLKNGTRVIVEGPYGVLVSHRKQGNSVVAFAAGIGITPIYSLLTEMRGANVTLIYRVSKKDNAPLQADLDKLFLERGWTIHYVSGPRRKVSLEPENLLKLAPEVERSEIYICGPEHFAQKITDSVSRLGVHKDYIYQESFGY